MGSNSQGWLFGLTLVIVFAMVGYTCRYLSQPTPAQPVPAHARPTDD